MRSHTGLLRWHWWLSVLMLSLTLWGVSPAKVEAASKKTITKTQHFVFEYDPRWSVVAKHLLKNAEKDLKELQTQLGYTMKGRFTVRISSPGKDYAAIQPHHWHPRSSIAGLAYPRKGLMTLRVKTMEGLKGVHQTFRHELSHLLLFRAVGFQKMPLWFVEGVAMVQSHDYGLWERYLLLSQAKVGGNIPEMSRLAQRFSGSQQDIQIAYAISSEFILFLKKKKPDFLRGMSASLRKGNTFYKALGSEVGAPWWKLLDLWKYHLQDRYHWLPVLSSSTMLWALFSLVFLVAWYRKRREKKERLAQMEEQERREDEHQERIRETLEVAGAMWEEMTPQERARLQSSKTWLA